MKDVLSVYKGKKVFITGHTGFKGAWLSLWLTYLGANVVGFSQKPPTKPNLFDAISLVENLEHIEGDIRDSEKLAESFQRHSPDIVFHLAAQPLVRLSYSQPLETYEINVVGTVKVMEAIRKTSSVRAAVIVTSDKCYMNMGSGLPFTEDDSLGGSDPYSSSKACAELAVISWRNSFFPTDQYQEHGVAIATARAGNVFGGGDWASDRIIPDCARAISENKPIVLRNPNSVRPWQFVLDPLYGYLLLGGKLYEHGPKEYGEAWNFSIDEGQDKTVEDLVKMFIENWGTGEYTIDTNCVKPLHEAKLLCLDSSKAHQKLSWRVYTSLAKAVINTTVWYKHFYNSDSTQVLNDLCVAQIKEHMALGQPLDSVKG